MLHGHDVFVRVATGGGKSTCMHLKPLVYSKPAFAIVISLLIAWTYGGTGNVVFSRYTCDITVNY